MFKVNNNDIRNDINYVVLVCLLLFRTYFKPFSSVSVVNFKQVNVCYDYSANLLIRNFE